MQANEHFHCPACRAKLRFAGRPKGRVTCPKCGHKFAFQEAAEHRDDAEPRHDVEHRSETISPASANEDVKDTSAFSLALEQATGHPPQQDADGEFARIDEESTDDDRLPPNQPPLPQRTRAPKKTAATSEEKPGALAPSRKSGHPAHVSRGRPMTIGIVIGGVLLLSGFIVVAGIALSRNSGREPAKFKKPEKYVAMRLGYLPLSGQMPEGWESNFGGGGMNAPPIFAKISDGGSISMELRESQILKLAQTLGGRNAMYSLDQVHEYHGAVTKRNFSNYKEEPERPINTEGFREACLSEFSGSESMFFGGTVKGYRVTLAEPSHFYNVICKCPPSVFEEVKPVFEKIIGSLGTGETRTDHH